MEHEEILGTCVFDHLGDRAGEVRIALVIPSLSAGGSERVITTVANRLATDPNIAVHLISLNDWKPFFQISSAVTLHQMPRCLPSWLPRAVRVGWRLRQLLQTLRPRCVVSFGSMYNTLVLIACIGLQAKLYVSDRSNPLRNTKFSIRRDPNQRHDGLVHWALKKLIYRRAEGILVQTELARQIERNFLNHKNVVLFPNPISMSSVAPIRSRDKIVLNIGRFIQTKNQIELIEIFAAARLPGWRLVLVGDGPVRDKVRRRATDLGLDSVVEFTGTVRSVESWLERSEIFAFTSLSEGFPNALAEAMSASLACISYDCIAGPSDIIQNEKNGYLLAVGDRQGFIRHLRELMSSPELRSQFQRVARDSLSHLSEERVVGDLKLELMK